MGDIGDHWSMHASKIIILCVGFEHFVVEVAADDFDEERMETLVGPAFDAASEEVSQHIRRCHFHSWIHCAGSRPTLQCLGFWSNLEVFLGCNVRWESDCCLDWVPQFHIIS